MGGSKATGSTSSVDAVYHRSAIRTAVIGGITLVAIVAIAIILLIHMT